MTDAPFEFFDEDEFTVADRGIANPPSNVLGVDTVLFDYGGVVGRHRVEPFWSRMAALLGVHPKNAIQYLSEDTPHGVAFRLGEISTEEFWGEVQRLAGVTGRDCRALMNNWTQSYAVDPRMVDISTILRSRGYQTGILMNSDKERLEYIKKIFHISNYYKYIIAPSTHFVIKPELEAYEVAKRVVDRSNTPQMILCIDDRKSNTDAGIQCGLQGYTFEGYQKFVDWLILTELIDKEDLCPWKNELYETEMSLIRTFFGHDLPMRPIPAEITKEQIDRWLEFQMSIRYLPNIDLDREDNLIWVHKLCKLFHESIEGDGSLGISANETLASVERPIHLGSGWFLI